MAYGLVDIQIIDGGNNTRQTVAWSDTGTVNGNLSWLQTIAGADGASPASSTNAFPVINEGGNVTITGNVTVGAGSAIIGALTANQTVDVTNTVNVTGNLTNGGNVTVTGNVALGASTAAIGNITALIDSLPPGSNIVGALLANQTVDVTNVVSTTVTGGTLSSAGNVTVSGNLTSGGNVTATPYSAAANWVRGTATVANTTATTVIAAQGAGNKTYVTALQLGNTGNTTISVTMSDSVSSVFVVPSGGGSNINFPVPLVTAANTTLTVTASGNTTSLTCSAQGYFGP